MINCIKIYINMKLRNKEKDAQIQFMNKQKRYRNVN